MSSTADDDLARDADDDALLLAATTLCRAAACNKGDADAAPAKTETMLVGPENVTVVRAEQIRSGPAISGSLAPERSATIRAEMSGAVVQTYAEAGQRVRARGRRSRSIDAAVLRDQALSARSALTTAQSSYDIAQREVERNEALEKAGAIAAARARARAQPAAHRRRRSSRRRARSYANAQQQLNKASVRAPFAGVVAQRQANAGDVVSPGTALFTVVDPASMQLEASVPAEALAQVRVGMPVEFSVNGYPNRTLHRPHHAREPRGRPGDAAGADHRGDPERREHARRRTVRRRAGVERDAHRADGGDGRGRRARAAADGGAAARAERSRRWK